MRDDVGFFLSLGYYIHVHTHTHVNLVHGLCNKLYQAVQSECFLQQPDSPCLIVSPLFPSVKLSPRFPASVCSPKAPWAKLLLFVILPVRLRWPQRVQMLDVNEPHHVPVLSLDELNLWGGTSSKWIQLENPYSFLAYLIIMTSKAFNHLDKGGVVAKGQRMLEKC